MKFTQAFAAVSAKIALCDTCQHDFLYKKGLSRPGDGDPLSMPVSCEVLDCDNAADREFPMVAYIERGGVFIIPKQAEVIGHRPIARSTS